MTALSVKQPYRIRECARHGGPVIEAVLNGQSYPFVQAAHHDGRWIVMTDPDFARNIDIGIRYAPTFTVWSHSDARDWVELLAALHTKTAAVAA